MEADELHVNGCLNLIGAFWKSVLRDLHDEDPLTRSEAQAFLSDEPFFSAWCRLGGTNFEPGAWREILMGGVLPRGALLFAFGE